MIVYTAICLHASDGPSEIKTKFHGVKMMDEGKVGMLCMEGGKRSILKLIEYQHF
jgi:hypothetical protein